MFFNNWLFLATIGKQIAEATTKIKIKISNYRMKINFYS